MALNRCEFIGNLGRDPEIRTTQGGKKVANLRIAVTDKWKDRETGERKESTEWVPCVIFGPLAGVAEQYLRKGSKVFVSGKFTTRKWTDQQGQDRYSTEVVLDEMEMLDGKPSGDRDAGQQSSGSRGGQSGGGDQQRGQSRQDLDDDIPF